MGDYDETNGYSNGDDCPEPGCDGIIEIRDTVDSDREGVDRVTYAQCTRCSFNTL